MIGEIDCREGILLAVERHKYNSVQDGMIQTMEIFMDVLKRLVSQFQFKVYIHPIVPVLNETRNIVTVYNALYYHRIASPDIQSLGVQWLDFFDDLLTPEGNQLQPNLELDATHLHPKYVSLIEREMNRLAERQSGAPNANQKADDEWLPTNNNNTTSKKKSQKKGKK